jgi:hypothetical protein
MAVEQEVVIVTGSARGGVCRIIYLVTLLLDEILTMSNFRRQDLCMLSAIRADEALVWSLAQPSNVLTMDGTRTVDRLHSTAASLVRALHPRTALGLFLETIKTLISDIREATSLHRRNVIPRTTSNQRNLSAAVVPQLTRTRRMHHLANLDLVHHLVPRPLLCLHHRLHVSHHKFLRMALAESLRFLDRHPHLL